MTIKEKILSKIEELNELKDKLLKSASFSDSDNDAHIYHSKGIGDISSTTGSTPHNIAEALTVIVEEVNTYYAMILSLPHIESSIIYRDRGIYDFGVVSDLSTGNIPVSWTLVSNGVSFESLQQQLPSSSFTGAIKEIEISSTPSFRKGGFEGTDISFEMVIFRINPRKNIKEEYTSGNGSLSLIIGDSILFGDDLLVVGFRPLQQILSTAIYYMDLSYSLRITRADNTVTEHMFTVSDMKIGNNTVDCDFSLEKGILFWDMITLNSFEVSYINTVGQSGTVMPMPPGTDLGGQTAGNVIDKIIVSGIPTTVGEALFSYRAGISARRLLDESPYSIYNRNENSISHIVIDNVRPIDLVLEEAINAL